MTLPWHDAAAGIWEACACRMAGEEAPPQLCPPPQPDSSKWFPCPEGRRDSRGQGRNLVYRRRDLG